MKYFICVGHANYGGGVISSFFTKLRRRNAGERTYSNYFFYNIGSSNADSVSDQQS